MGDPRSMEYMKGRKILEINPEHDIIRGIRALLKVRGPPPPPAPPHPNTACFCAGLGIPLLRFLGSRCTRHKE
jgi:hypothetical protein